MLLARRVIITLRGLRGDGNTSLSRRLSLVAVNRARIRLRTISLRRTAAARSSRNNRRIPNSIRVDIAVVTPEASDSHCQGRRRQQLWLVVIINGHLVLRHVPEGRLVQHDGVVQATEVGVRGHLLVARVAFALRDGAHGLVRVHAEVVKVSEVELVVLEQGAEAADGGHLVRVDGDDRVVDSGAAAVHAAHVSERDSDCRRCDCDSFGDERIGRTSRRCGDGGTRVTAQISAPASCYGPEHDSCGRCGDLAVVAGLAVCCVGGERVAGGGRDSAHWRLDCRFAIARDQTRDLRVIHTRHGLAIVGLDRAGCWGRIGRVEFRFCVDVRPSCC
jgi:hypothetical protein